MEDGVVWGALRRATLSDVQLAVAVVTMRLEQPKNATVLKPKVLHKALRKAGLCPKQWGHLRALPLISSSQTYRQRDAVFESTEPTCSRLPAEVCGGHDGAQLRVLLSAGGSVRRAARAGSCQLPTRDCQGPGKGLYVVGPAGIRGVRWGLRRRRLSSRNVTMTRSFVT